LSGPLASVDAERRGHVDPAAAVERIGAARAEVVGALLDRRLELPGLPQSRCR
jgi:hypothetical protein